MLVTTEPGTGLELVAKLLREARRAGADCIATACPLCQINLEAYQDKVSEAVGGDCRLPVLYFTQLMGAAFGLEAKDLALKDSLTSVEALIVERVGT